MGSPESPERSSELTLELTPNARREIPREWVWRQGETSGVSLDLTELISRWEPGRLASARPEDVSTALEAHLRKAVADQIWPN